jgi:hypothetical protein
MSRRSTVELPESARRFHELYRSDLTAVEPVRYSRRSTAPKHTTAIRSPTPAGGTLPRIWGSYTTRGRHGGCGRRWTRSGRLAVSATFVVLALIWLR